jgi:hypothetical protein
MTEGGRMLDLVLTAQERDELRLVLESYLGDLSVEIRRTDGYDFREVLKERRTVLQQVLRNLIRISEASNAASREG